MQFAALHPETRLMLNSWRALNGFENDEIAQNIKSVSYTHLDVYKRQILKRLVLKITYYIVLNQIILCGKNALQRCFLVWLL